MLCRQITLLQSLTPAQMCVPLRANACPGSMLALQRHAGGSLCQLGSAKGDAREHLNVKRSNAMGAHVHLAALNAHIDALSAGSESQPRQRTGLAQQSSYAGIYVDDLQKTVLALQACHQLGAQWACVFSAAHPQNNFCLACILAHGMKSIWSRTWSGQRRRSCHPDLLFGVPELEQCKKQAGLSFKSHLLMPEVPGVDDVGVAAVLIEGEQVCGTVAKFDAAAGAQARLPISPSQLCHPLHVLVCQFSGLQPKA